MKLRKMIIMGLAVAMTFSIPVFADDDTPGDNTNMDEAIEISVDDKTYGNTANGSTFWYSFVPETDGDYAVFAVNTGGGRSLMMNLYDDEGDVISDSKGVEVPVSGAIRSASASLKQDRTYYSGICTKDNKADNIGYVLVVHKIDDGDDGNILQADASDTSEERTGYSMEEAIAVPLNEKLAGEVDDHPYWYMFETNDGGEYTVSVVDKSEGNQKLGFGLYSSAGERLNKENKGKYAVAKKNGAATNIRADLDPESVYYVGVWNESKKSDKLDFSLTVKDGSGKAVNANSEEKKTDTKTDSAESEEDIFD